MTNSFIDLYSATLANTRKSLSTGSLRVGLSELGERLQRKKQVQGIGRRRLETRYVMHVEVSGRLITTMDQQCSETHISRDLQAPQQDVLDQCSTNTSTLSSLVNPQSGQQQHGDGVRRILAR